ncbi:hypothetical protein [Luteimonas sp. e5]
MPVQAPVSAAARVQSVLSLLFLGAAASALLLPFLQVHAAIGWLPLWLVGLPGSAWLCAHGLQRLRSAPSGSRMQEGARLPRMRRRDPAATWRRRESRLPQRGVRHGRA